MAAPIIKFPEKLNQRSAEINAAVNEQTEKASQFKLHRAQNHDEGESIWLLSYADLMTLLFSFFVLLMSFSKIDVESFEKVRKETTEIIGGE